MVTPIGEPAWLSMLNQAFQLDAPVLDALSPLLILVPHPDDETLGCGGLIATACSMGLKPRVAYLTDGEASHTSSPTWPPERLAATRRREALDALAVLGVPSTDVLFLGWPDGKPFERATPGHAKSLDQLRAWAEPFRPWSVWAPWRDEPHCDHVAANLLGDDYVATVQDRGLVRMDYLVWGWANPDLAQCHGAKGVWGLMCSEHIMRRRQALERHQTQMSPLILDATKAFQIPPELAALTDRPAEIFLECRR